MENATLQICNCHKRFPGVYALKNVSLEARAGEIVALLGVNGAGKSTLMNILGGVYQADEGEIRINGEVKKIMNPGDSRACKIAFIQQEVQLFGNLTVYENIFLVNLSHYRKVSFLPILDKKRLCEESTALLRPLGCEINPKAKVNTLSVGDQQMVQIARALSLGGEILLFDEPTSSLSVKEKENLFNVIRKLKEAGKTIIYITHYLDEVEKLCDKVIIMRDGEVVCTDDMKNMTKDKIVDFMVPNKVVYADVESHLTDEVMLKVEHLEGEKLPRDISFELRKGEVLGLWGLLGSGRTETVRALLGLDPIVNGSISVRSGEELVPITPAKLAKKCGYVTEGRHYDGLYLPLPIWENTTSANLGAFKSGIFSVIDKKKEVEEGDRFVEKLRIKTPSAQTLVGQLSGGNQQKVVISKWLSKNPEILILDEPTRGVDVGSKVEIQNLIRQLAASGVSCIVISSESEEIQKISDRIIVLREGRLTATLEADEINNQRLIKECIGEG